MAQIIRKAECDTGQALGPAGDPQTTGGAIAQDEMEQPGFGSPPV